MQLTRLLNPVRLADRDMFMRFRGGGVGHMYMRQVEPWLDATGWGTMWPALGDREPVSSRPTPPAPANRASEVDEDTDEDTESDDSEDETGNVDDNGEDDDGEDPEQPEEEKDLDEDEDDGQNTHGHTHPGGDDDNDTEDEAEHSMRDTGL